MEAGKRRGTVHPSNSLSPSPPPARPSSSASRRNPESVLKLLPVTILALGLSLQTQDREVLAYFLARSILNPSSSSSNNKCKKRTTVSDNGGPSFGCGCFECYTSFWFRWDSSPNRELIDQVIEAFEEHLVTNETTKTKTKKKKKNNHINPSSNKAKQAGVCNFEEEVVLVPDEVEVEVEMEMEKEKGRGRGADVAAELGRGGGGRSDHKCLARKVLPDVVGLFNSRFWNFWSAGN